MCCSGVRHEARFRGHVRARRHIGEPARNDTTRGERLPMSRVRHQVGRSTAFPGPARQQALRTCSRLLSSFRHPQNRRRLRAAEAGRAALPRFPAGGRHMARHDCPRAAALRHVAGCPLTDVHQAAGCVFKQATPPHRKGPFRPHPASYALSGAVFLLSTPAEASPVPAGQESPRPGTPATLDVGAVTPAQPIRVLSGIGARGRWRVR